MRFATIAYLKELGFISKLQKGKKKSES